MIETSTPWSDLSTRKQTIARHFAKANTYDQHAYIQQHICQNLLTYIRNPSQDSVLEVGAGTGQMTQLLAAALQSKRWIINELCPQQTGHLQSILPTAQLRIGDAETIDLDTNHSLIISANAIQWFDDPLRFIAQCSTRLKPSGQLLLSTFTANNFLQIKSLTGQGLQYPDSAAWQAALHNHGFDQIELSTQRFDIPFAKPYEVLKHMKGTGVSTNQTQSIRAKEESEVTPFVWTKARLQQFEREYWQKFSGQDDHGQPCVYLTYEALIISAYQP
ncbi:methyltransferase domain-containing protein [Psychrobacter alimentarius]|uniref:methyltransferase domain-containing protein n=1 Tax=Psychrobacter alimentarius TaxID=261164 RepID=UPI001918931B|nr:methyltransferase domain-containing protein [Psychrobacter alimentarius]